MQDSHFRSVEDVGIPMPFGTESVIDSLDLAGIALSAGMMRGEGIVAAAKAIAADPGSTLRAILGIVKHLVFERTQQAINEIAAAAPKLGCRKGCSHCCYQRVEVTIPEAILVFAHVGLPTDPRHQKVVELAATLTGLQKMERLRLVEPCPMLVDKQCSVYEDRPLICRGVLAGDAGLCRKNLDDLLKGRDARPIELYPFAQVSAFGAQAAIRGICKDMGLQHDLVELTLAVGAMIRDPTIIDRWLAGERVFGPEFYYYYDPAAHGDPPQTTEQTEHGAL
jgi:hypothetical protein